MFGGRESRRKACLPLFDQSLAVREDEREMKNREGDIHEELDRFTRLLEVLVKSQSPGVTRTEVEGEL